MPDTPDWTWSSFTRFMDERFDHLDDRFEVVADALELQAKEYARRLDELNHAHQEALRVQHTYVTADKYEDKLKSEETARAFALDRMDEKFEAAIKTLTVKLEDYITKTEARQNGIDQAIAIQKASAEDAARSAEAQGRLAQAKSEEQSRKTNRNLAVVSLLLTVIIIATNFIPAT